MKPIHAISCEWVFCFWGETIMTKKRAESSTLKIGQKIERWTIIGDCVTDSWDKKRWLCRCECGTERYVLERSLKYRESQSCGCLRREQAQKAIAISDIEGKSFGELTALHKAENQRKNGGIWWTCRCSCGNLYDVPGTLLVSGKRTRCSSKVHTKRYATADITGKRFYRLIALYPTKERSRRCSVIWHCRCDCGNEIDVDYNSLMYCDIKSCGCQKKEHEGFLKYHLTHVAGTSLDILKSNKVPVNNTTGVKGVYHIKGKWVAKIVFQQKAYYLGAYTDFNKAVQVRREAEQIFCHGTVAHYTRWKAKADVDPDWAKENPIEIRVEKKKNEEISITFLPVIEDYCCQ